MLHAAGASSKGKTEQALCPLHLLARRLLVTLTRHFQRGGDRSQAEQGLGVNRR